MRRFANRHCEADSNQLRDWPFVSRLHPMPAQQPAKQLNDGGRSQLPHWLRIVVFGRNPKVTLARALALAVICFIVFKFVLLHIRVEGISMTPNYPDQSVHYVNRLAYLWHGPRRGDVVGIRPSEPSIMGPSVMYLKRIIGLPGETVAFVNGKVLINGEVLDEPYEKLPCNWNRPPVKLGPDEYFAVGDNRTMPAELHEFGKVKRNRIVGKAMK
jgi:signal peptidase I